MLEGRLVSLRPVREADLDRLYDAHTAIRARGAFFPLGVLSEPAFRRETPSSFPTSCTTTATPVTAM